MQKTFIFLLCSTICLKLFGQEAILNVKIDNTKEKHFTLRLLSSSLPWSEKFVKGSVTINFKKSGFTSYAIALNYPQFIELICYSDSAQKEKIHYPFFLSPNDNLYFTANFKKENYTIKVTGKGSQNNQPFSDIWSGFNSRLLFGDTLPFRLIDSLKKYNAIHEKKFKKYEDMFHPTHAFVKSMQYDLKYYAPLIFYAFKTENKYRIKNTSYTTNSKIWEHNLDSLLSLISLNNDMALISPNYRGLVSTFLQRKKEELWSNFYDNSEEFIEQWYSETDTNKGRELFLADRENILTEKIINRFFTGKSAEYAYALLFDIASYFNRIENIPEIFSRFKQKYPNSKFISAFTSWITKINRSAADSNSKKIVLFGNGNKINTLDTIYKLLKGKIGLVYVWGTWCSPCRNELVNNIPLIRKHFKDKDLEIVFIALNDETNEKKWRDLIMYLNLQGIHVLANQDLNFDILTKTKITSVSSYIIIQKDNTFKLSDSGHPSNSQVLINEIEGALRRASNLERSNIRDYRTYKLN